MMKPEAVISFTTVVIETNCLGTARDGKVSYEARLVHGARMTKVWDATATHVENYKTPAMFRCTQMWLCPC